VLEGVAVLEQRVRHEELEVEEERGAEAGNQEQPYQTGTSLSGPFVRERIGATFRRRLPQTGLLGWPAIALGDF